MSVAIVTDTNSGISPEEGKRAGISVIPMPVIVDGKSYFEYVDIDHKELYKAMRAGLSVSTSQPSPQSLKDCWDKLLKINEEIVFIPMSSGLSNTCETALKCAEEYGGRVQVADNHRISMTLRESVCDAKYLAESGESALQIKNRLESEAYNASIYITVDSLSYLKKSGRVTAAAAAIATVLNVKPVMTIQGGKLDAFKKVRGMHKSKAVMLEAVAADKKSRFKDCSEQNLVLACAGTLETQEEIDECVNLLRKAYPGYTVYYTPLSCSIACHTGIGAIGMGVCKLIRTI